MVIGILVVVLGSLVVSACSAEDTAAPSEPTTPLPVSFDEELVPAVPVDDSPFCRTMRELDEAGEREASAGAGSGAGSDGPTRERLVAAYVDIAEEVPAEIRPAFDVVLARLVALTGDRVDATDDPIDEAVAEEALVELAEFVERRCRGTVTNPLPPPTVPP